MTVAVRDTEPDARRLTELINKVDHWDAVEVGRKVPHNPAPDPALIITLASHAQDKL